MRYEYKLLYYVHDTLREESVNVGILFHCFENKQVKFGIRTDLKKLKSIFPDFDPSSLNKYLKVLERSFIDYQAKYSHQLPLHADIEKFSVEVLPHDASSIKWGRKGSGITEDSEDTFNRLFHRFVSQKHSQAGDGRNDYKVWATFKAELKQRNMLEHLKPTRISLSGFTEQLEHTYQNGALHCLKPISLDIASEETILDKVFRIKGWHEAIVKSNPDREFQFYYLLGKPTRPELLSSFENAYHLLSQDESAVLITEDRAAELPSMLSKFVHA